MCFKQLKKCKGTMFFRKEERYFFGQATLEFTFVMLLVFLLIIGLVRTFGWVGKELALRRKAHVDVLNSGGRGGIAAMRITRPEFYRVTVINAYFHSNLFDDNTK